MDNTCRMEDLIIGGNINQFLNEYNIEASKIKLDDEKLTIHIKNCSAELSDKFDLREAIKDYDGLVDSQWFVKQNPSELKLVAYFDRG